MLIWIENAPVYKHGDELIAQQFIDKHLSCEKKADIPILINYQTHRHARTCRKKDKPICRFGFPLPPMPATQNFTTFDSNTLIYGK